MRAGAVAHALDSQFGEFRYRRDTWAGENIHGGHPMNIAEVVFLQIGGGQIIGAQVVDDSLDVIGVAQARNKDAVGTGLEISLAALKGAAHGFRGLDAGLPISVRAGIDDEMNSRGLGGASCGLDARDLLRQRKERAAVADRGCLFGVGLPRIAICGGGIFRIGSFMIGIFWAAIFGTSILRIGVGWHYIFQVHADGSCIDDLSNGSFKGCNVGGEAGLNIGSDGHFDGAADAGDSVKHLRPGKVLSIWEAESIGHGRAAGGDGGQSAMLDHGGAGCVPGIDEDERLRGVMQLKQP